jgi:hypothetical protein
MQVSLDRLSTLVRFSLLVSALACGGDSDGDGGLCTTFSACGGDPTGTWQSQDLCLPDDFADQVVMNLPPECDGSITVDNVASNTTLTFGADGTFTETGSATTELAMSFSQACISAAGGQPADDLLVGLFCDQVRDALTENAGMGPAEATCEVVDDACECATRQETAVDEAGEFTVEGTDIVYGSAGGLRGPFCVRGEQLKIGSPADTGLDAHVVYTRSSP